MMDQSRRLLLSVKPRFAATILDGSKGVELRRSRPRLHIPTEALLYASSPECALVGTCDVIDVLEHPLSDMWRLVGTKTTVTYPEFCAYFDGCNTAYGLVLTNARRLSSGITLPAIRNAWQGFQPPQSFRYLTRSHSDEVLALAG